MVSRRNLICGLLPVLFFSLSACKSAPDVAVPDVAAKATASLQVMASYRERMMLLPGAELTVTLEDVSRADAPSVVLAKAVVPAESGPPYSVSLPYDAAAIRPTLRYTVRAKISKGEKLIFTSTEHIDPFATQANGNVQVLMQRVSQR